MDKLFEEAKPTWNMDDIGTFLKKEAENPNVSIILLKSVFDLSLSEVREILES